MNTGRRNVREGLFGGVFLVIGLLQMVLFVIRAEPHPVNVVLGAVFLVAGAYFSLSAIRHRQSDSKEA